MVIHFGFKQFLFQIFLVASFNLVAIPDILCYSSLCLRTPIPHRSVCPLDFALLTEYGSATRQKRRRSTCGILVTFTQNNSHDQTCRHFLETVAVCIHALVDAFLQGKIAHTLAAVSGMAGCQQQALSCK